MSTLRLTTISNQSGSSSVPSDTVISGSAKAWVNFNGTGTVAIRASFNVSSITDNGLGDYTANFTTAMVDANYSLSGTAAISSGGNFVWGICPQSDIANFTAGSIRFKVKEASGSSPQDSTFVCISIFR